MLLVNKLSTSVMVSRLSIELVVFLMEENEFVSANDSYGVFAMSATYEFS
jgi:argininosuccinate lyase